MGAKTHKTAVVVLPPEELWPPIQAIRRERDRHFRRWMPHITLIYPFRPLGESAEVANSFWEVCQGIAPFEVELARFRTFRHGAAGGTVWLDPQPRAELVRLQTALWGVVPDCDETRRHAGGFTPHLSVGQVRGRARGTIDALQAAWEAVAFRVAAVHLIWREDPPDDVFRVGWAVRLSG